MTNIAVIPARGSSKGLPNKNILDLGGKPLIAWTIEASLNSRVDRTIVSTDSKEIAKIAKEYGAEVPFIRPKYLAEDTSHTPDVIKHAVNKVNSDADIVLTLQCTSPFRTSYHIDRALGRYDIKLYDSLISIKKNEYPAEWLLTLYESSEYEILGNNDTKKHTLKEIDMPYKGDIENPFNLERQQFSPVYLPNGAIYITERNFLETENSIVNIHNCGYYIMDDHSSVDIDTKYDYMIAKEMIK